MPMQEGGQWGQSEGLQRGHLYGGGGSPAQLEALTQLSSMLQRRQLQPAQRDTLTQLLGNLFTRPTKQPRASSATGPTLLS